MIKARYVGSNESTVCSMVLSNGTVVYLSGSYAYYKDFKFPVTCDDVFVLVL